MTQLQLLPPPNLADLLREIKTTKRLLDLCVLAENHIQAPWIKPKRIPKRFYGNPKNAVIASLQSELCTAIYFFDLAQHEADLRHRVPAQKEKVQYTIKLVREEAWTVHINEEYEETFTRFRDGCTAYYNGYTPAPNDLRVFTQKEVERAFEGCKDSQHGVVQLRHIYNVLSSQAMR